jgi:hypothetical protein
MLLCHSMALHIIEKKLTMPFGAHAPVWAA